MPAYRREQPRIPWTAVYNNLESVKMLFEENEGQIAAVIVEPVAANMGVVLPKEGFLKGLRELCTNHGAVLIFDEVITGFRRHSVVRRSGSESRRIW